jgi:disulfide bond formation protein DsbB
MTKTLIPKISRLKSLIEHSKHLILYAAWIVSIAAFLGSLTFSEVLKLTPCKLCWIQRIFMFPLVFILGVGIIFKDQKIPYYVLPLSLIGLAISFYHVLLYRGILPEAKGFCEAGISCTTKYIEFFGFLSIPMLSFLAFLIITTLMFYYHSLKNYKQNEN